MLVAMKECSSAEVEGQQSIEDRALAALMCKTAVDALQPEAIFRVMDPSTLRPVVRQLVERV